MLQEMGEKAFGKAGTCVFRFIFIVDLFFTASSYLVLIAQTLKALNKGFDINLVKMAVAGVVVPVLLRLIG